MYKRFIMSDEAAQTLPYVPVAVQTKNCGFCIDNVTNEFVELLYRWISNSGVLLIVQLCKGNPAW